MNLTPEFRAAINVQLRLVEALGIDHPESMRAMVLAIELAPEELKNKMADVAREMGLMPEANGYLDDGSPIFRLEDIAARLGMSIAEAEEAMHKMFTDREALGLSNSGIVTDATLIQRKQ